ncbi:hypothetical protein [uncultured Microbacterium sp.]|uniref:hypothetical protein n=1 Tax=uncultured Microbacterium sp. TaxID=191216 RepID=UPI0025F652B3|nr:hypothetical protein [uncultured Microbacterium sp.]
MTNGRAEKQGDGTLRTDLAPIAERYPQLASAESITWMGGTTGTSDIGPTTYWVDVVAVLPQSEVDTLQTTGDLSPVQVPDVVSGMRDELPAGPFEGSTALDELFSTDGRSATVALDPRTRTIVLSGRFE